MNYYDARQMKNGKWHYTCQNNSYIWPTGYCADACPGHDTKEEAYEHQKQYELDYKLSLDGVMTNQQRKCEVCDTWTNKVATLGSWNSWILCDKHRTREEVAKRHTVGYAISST